MYKINHLKISGIRKLRAIDIQTRPLMVLIGANGVGKTSLLDAYSLLSASAVGNLGKNLSKAGGMSSILTRDKAEELSLYVDMNVPGHQPLEYELRLATSGTGYRISRELLSQRRIEDKAEGFKHIVSQDGDIRYYDSDNGGLVRPNWEYNPMKHRYPRCLKCSGNQKN